MMNGQKQNNINVELIDNQLKKSILKLLGRDHVIDVLKALNDNREQGLSYKYLKFTTLQSGTLDSLIEPLKKTQLIYQKQKNGNYFISEIGMKVLPLAISIQKTWERGAAIIE
ncbi:MAG: hypothetical protein ACYCSG_00645 [Thermoplasmataceae archaeon]